MRALLIVLALGAALVAPGLANAAPGNDSFVAATSIGALPYADDVNLDGAGTEPGEPQICNFQQQTAWYSYTASSATALKIDLNGSDFGVVFNLWRSFGGGLGGLNFAGCAGSGGELRITVPAGGTIYVQAGSVSFGPAMLHLHVAQIPPPPNDGFAAAATVGQLPYFNSVDGTSATVETGEPTLPSGAFTPITASTWYSFTAPETRSYVLEGSVPCTSAMITAYVGDSLAGLQEAVSASGFRTFLRAEAGTTYRIQLGRGSTDCTGSMSLNVRQAAQLSAGFFLNPQDPSSYDTAQFSSFAFDPDGAPITSMHWDFGDGTEADGCCAGHRFPSDGDYTVTLTVRTNDGRTGTSSSSVHVRTHDVGIAKLTVPQSASAGQTRTISVAISNTRFPETVTVRLLRSVPGGGWEQVGSLTQSAPVRTSGRTTSFAINYTFTAADAAVGKVTFRAVAELNGARDALPADNDVAALATKVTR
jgi:hypothetical protein